MKGDFKKRYTVCSRINYTISKIRFAQVSERNRMEKMNVFYEAAQFVLATTARICTHQYCHNVHDRRMYFSGRVIHRNEKLCAGTTCVSRSFQV